MNRRVGARPKAFAALLTLVVVAVASYLWADGRSSAGKAAVPASGAGQPAEPSSSPPAGSGGTAVQAGREDFVAATCAIPHKELVRIWRGTRLDRGGDVLLLPKAPNFVSGGLSHAGPWPYLQRVPIFYYGPGIVPARGEVSQPVTSADIAPTTGLLLNFDFPALDGHARTQVLPDGGLTKVPKLIVVMVWDAAGIDVLDAWPDQWSYLRSLIPKGVWFSNATIGSSPSNTPPIHATIGTGAFPIHHGLLDEFIRVNGEIQKPQEDGPAFLLLPTLADLYDLSTGNLSVVGGVATLSSHLGMLSHGSQWGGGDEDIAVTREHLNAATGGAEGDIWNLTPAMHPFFDFPAYVNDVPGWEDDVRTIDQSDGARDGLWLDNSIERLANGFDTPARTIYQTQVTEEIMRQEGFGKDDVPDLLFLNYKAIDSIGHWFSLNSPEMRDTVQIQDEDLRRFVAFLNHQVGKGEWAMVVTADHGHQYDPEVSGAFQISVDKMQALIDERFSPAGGPKAVEKIRPTQIWLNTSALRRAGFTVDDVARFVMGLTQQDTFKPNATVQPGKAGERVFAAAFPSDILSRLPCLPEAREG